MSILSDTPASDAETEGDAIAALKEAFARQRAAFAKDRHPSLDVRRERLGALIAMMMGNRERISHAIASDFGAHPAPASDLIEVLGVVGRAQYALENLEEWSRPSVRHIDPGLFGTAHAQIEYQPKGVIGNIVP